MAIALDARTTGVASGGATTFSWTHNLGGSLSNGIIVVPVSTFNATNQSVSGINWDDTGTPVALTRKIRANDSFGNCWAELWYLLAPAVSGLKTIKVSFSVSSSAITGSVSFSGVDQTTVFNAASGQSATGSAPTQPSLGITTTAGEWAIAAMVDNEGANDTIGVGGGANTIYAAQTGGNIGGGASDLSASGTTTTLSYTGATQVWAIVGVSIIPASGGGGGGFVRPMIDVVRQSVIRSVTW